MLNQIQFSAMRLGPIAAENFQRMVRTSYAPLECLACGEMTSYMEFCAMVDSGNYNHYQMAEILISGTHPGCWHLLTEWPHVNPCKE